MRGEVVDDKDDDVGGVRMTMIVDDDENTMIVKIENRDCGCVNHLFLICGCLWLVVEVWRWNGMRTSWL